MKTNLLLRTLFVFLSILQFLIEQYNGNKKIKKNNNQNSLSNPNSIDNDYTNLTINKNNDFIFEKRVENDESSSKMSCNLPKDCKECQLTSFQVRCHDKICYCCGSDKKCYCQTQF